MATYQFDKEIRELLDKYTATDHEYTTEWRAFEEAHEARFKLCDELRDGRNTARSELIKALRERAKELWEEKELTKIELGPFTSQVPLSVKVDVDKFYQMIARKNKALAEKAFDDGALVQEVKATDKLKGWAAANGFTKQLEACTRTDALPVRVTGPHDIPPFGQPYKEK